MRTGERDQATGWTVALVRLRYEQLRACNYDDRPGQKRAEI